MDNKNYKLKGSITVFLSLVLLLVLSLVMTILEGAKINTAKVMAERALFTSMDSALAEFYAPLFNEYHILALDVGYGGTKANKERLISKMEEYMEYTFFPNQNRKSYSSATELYHINISKINIPSWTSLTQQQGELFIDEAVEYMKYKGVAKAAELILDKMSLLEDAKKTLSLYKSKLKIEEQLIDVDKSILNLMDCLKETNKKENFISLFDEIDEYLEKAEQANKDKEDGQLSFQETERNFKEEILVRKNVLYEWAASIEPSINEGIEITNLIIEKMNYTEPLITEYEKILGKEKSNLSSQIYENLNDNYQDIKKYSLDNKEGYDFTNIKDLLKSNQAVVESLKNNLDQLELRLEKGEYEEVREMFSLCREDLLRYSSQGFELYSSGLAVGDKADSDALESISSTIKGGVLGVVTGGNTVSTAQISIANLPSISENIKSKTKEFDFKAFFSSIKSGIEGLDIASLFEGLDTYNLGETTKKGKDQVVKTLLFQEYLIEHFYKYPKADEDLTKRKPTVLSYELEYLIAGKDLDKDNLSSIVNRILLIRTITDFITILGDRSKVIEAKELAAVLVGFTGLPLLVSALQTVFMFSLAFAEALIDTCALLLGKELPILKKKTVLEYKDIFLLNKSFIKSKAQGLSNNPKGKTLTYEDYLRIFLLTTNKKDLSYRAMDLIQENIKIRYQDSFLIKNCLYSLKAEAEFVINPSFVNISYINDKVNGSHEDFDFKTSLSYSY